MKKEALLVKAFTQNPNQGNPAGVIVDEQDLTDLQMISIASMLGFSESAFLLPSQVADYKVRFFTPTKEVALCGHATIATFFSLVEKGRILFGNSNEVTVTQETGAGILNVVCNKDGMIVMEQAKPVFYDRQFNRDEIAAFLGVETSTISDLPIELISTGTPKLIIPVNSLDALKNMKPNVEAMSQFCATSEVRGFYPFTVETIEGSDVHARQFNPYAGIEEDPITGVAAGALGVYAVRHRLSHKNTFVIEQGYVLNKGGKMFVTVNEDSVRVGGYAVICGKKEVEIA